MSQRPRRPYGTLHRDVVIDAALQVIERDGLAALTMRRLAQQLDAGTMSLYRHVADRDDVLDAVGQRLLLSIEVPDPSSTTDWPGAIRALMTSIRSVALEHPRSFELMALRQLSGGAVDDRVASALLLLEPSGLSRAEQLVLARTLVSFVNGFALAEIRGTTRFAGEPDGVDAFSAGIDLILAGAAAGSRD
ncbi:MAG: TetR family transcriptional regulator [Actinomycetota bacterium]